MDVISIKLENRRIHCSQVDEFDPRNLSEEDFRNFESWSDSYNALLDKRDNESELFALGRKIYDWLDGDARWLARIKQKIPAPLIFEFEVSLRPDADEKSFLMLPWELLADKDGFWAKNTKLAFIALRRLGTAKTPAAPSIYRLSTVFMAASPRGAEISRAGKLYELDYEQEESAILKAAGGIGMDLVVEESGSLTYLQELLSTIENIDVLHISCHGRSGKKPLLLLEDEFGDKHDADADQLAGHVNQSNPSLLFLSACESGKTSRVADAMALELLSQNVSAVLGWAGSVSDAEATRFAQGLYRELALGQSLQAAVAAGRMRVLAGEPDKAGEVRSPRDWHLARLFLGSKGGGVLCKGRTARVRDAKAIHRKFLDIVNKRVPVAAPEEFVGRRRQVQKILAAFRQGERKGVYIHGVGKQGKSSLAARIALRMHDYNTVVLHGAYDEQSVLNAFAIIESTKERREFIDRARREVKEDTSRFPQVMQELLHTHFNDFSRDEKGKRRTRPALLIIDDFEQVLEERREAAHKVKASFAPAIRGLIQAFNSSETKSRLLFTSRYTFKLEHQGKDLAQRLYHVPLPPMREHESRKQAAAKSRSEAEQKRTQLEIEASRLKSIIAVAQCNPGLQDLLSNLAITHPEECDAALAEMRAYIESGQMPQQRELLAFFEDLKIQQILSLLSVGERELLRMATAFTLPLPLEIYMALCEHLSLGKPQIVLEHLLGLGVWDQFEDLVESNTSAAAINALFLPFAGQLAEREIESFVKPILPKLFNLWGGDNSEKRPYPVDLELVRLGLIARNGEVVHSTAEDAVFWLGMRNEHRAAATLGKEALELLKECGKSPVGNLLRFSGEQARIVGDVGFARECFKQAIDEFEKGGDSTESELGFALTSLGRQTNNEGRPDEALALLQRALGILQKDSRSRAVTLGDIARIYVDKGKVDEALKLHKELLSDFERLGDLRSRAVTLGDIARIYVDKGKVDEALKLHKERLGEFERLGDLRSRAVTLGNIAQIYVAKGKVDEALKLHKELLSEFERLGDLRSRALILGYIARIYGDKGKVDEALKLHEEELLEYERLGDLRLRAVTLGYIARIYVDKGKVDEALKLHKEQLKDFERLGDLRERAVALGYIARIYVDKGKVDEALKLHEERLSEFERLGDLRERAVTLGDIARIYGDKGKVDEALKLHKEQLKDFERLGDLRSRAVTLGYIARIYGDKGKVDEALKLHEEELSEFERLGDLRSRAVALGYIAQIYGDKGKVDEALKLHEERLSEFERLGDLRSRAVALGDIARIYMDKGKVDKALKLLEEVLSEYERLGDPRSRAVTLGDIARVYVTKSKVGEALRLLEEKLATVEKLEDVALIAQTHWSIAQIESDGQKKFQHLALSFKLNLKIGHLEGISVVGVELGRLLCEAGLPEQGRPILERSRDGFLQIGNSENAEFAQALIDQCQDTSPENSTDEESSKE